MMMTQTFVATIAFSNGLLAFAAGAWLTVWANINSQHADTSAAKLTGYFVTILSLLALVFTSYFIAMGVLGADTAPYSPRPYKMMKDMKQQGKMHDKHKAAATPATVEPTEMQTPR